MLGKRVNVIACDFIYRIAHDMTSEHSDGVIEAFVAFGIRWWIWLLVLLLDLCI